MNRKIVSVLSLLILFTGVVSAQTFEESFEDQNVDGWSTSYSDSDYYFTDNHSVDGQYSLVVNNSSNSGHFKREVGGSNKITGHIRRGAAFTYGSGVGGGGQADDGIQVIENAGSIYLAVYQDASLYKSYELYTASDEWYKVEYYTNNDTVTVEGLSSGNTDTRQVNVSVGDTKYSTLRYSGSKSEAGIYDLFTSSSLSTGSSPVFSIEPKAGPSKFSESDNSNAPGWSVKGNADSVVSTGSGKISLEGTEESRIVNIRKSDSSSCEAFEVHESFVNLEKDSDIGYSVDSEENLDCTVTLESAGSSQTVTLKHRTGFLSATLARISSFF